MASKDVSTMSEADLLVHVKDLLARRKDDEVLQIINNQPIFDHDSKDGKANLLGVLNLAQEPLLKPKREEGEVRLRMLQIGEAFPASNVPANAQLDDASKAYIKGLDELQIALAESIAKLRSSTTDAKRFEMLHESVRAAVHALLDLEHCFQIPEMLMDKIEKVLKERRETETALVATNANLRQIEKILPKAMAEKAGLQ